MTTAEERARAAEKRVSDQRNANRELQRTTDRYRAALEAIERKARGTGNECVDDDPAVVRIREIAAQALRPSK